MSRLSSHASLFSAKNPANQTYITCALNKFDELSLDISARGLLRALRSDNVLSKTEVLTQLLPRDYDVAVSSRQIDELILSLESV